MTCLVSYIIPKKKHILMSFLGLIALATLTVGCEESDRKKRHNVYVKRQNAYEKARKEIPRDAYPDVYYDKFGDNWYKFRTWASDERTSIPDYPVLRVKYVKGEKLPVVLDNATRKSDYFSIRAYQPTARRYKDIMQKYQVERFRFEKSVLLIEPRKRDKWELSKIKWPAISEDFEVWGWKNDGKHPKILRSRKPIFFDQHVYLTYGGLDIRTGLDPTTNEYIKSDYPYVEVRLETVFLEERGLRRAGLQQGSDEYLDVFSRYLKAKVQFLEALVADVYVGPELPEDVKALAAGLE